MTTQEPSDFSRRDLLATGLASLAAITATTAVPLPAVAAVAADDAPVYYNPTDVQQAFDRIRFELEDPEGGVAYMQSCVDRRDYAALLEFTKTYDLELRKAKLSAAKKKFKMGGDRPTQLCNNVTFDLIGMNKACRPGQENIDLAQKYLTELKRDVAQFLALQSTILVESS